MYIPYICDVETTGLNLINCDIIELSLIRFTTGEQKTWHLKAQNVEAIEDGALRINGHKREDITWQTAHGRSLYKDPNDIIIEIENWIMEDDIPTENRIFVAHNVIFDLPRMQRLWEKCNSSDSFVFGRRSFDTMSIEFFIDWAQDNLQKGYSLKNLCKKYGLKNDKAHSAAADTKVAAEVFDAQIKSFKEVLSGGNSHIMAENEKMKTFINNVGEIISKLDQKDIPSSDVEGASIDIHELYKKYLK